MDDEMPQERYEALRILLESLNTRGLDDEKGEWYDADWSEETATAAKRESFTDDQAEDNDDIEVYTSFNV